MAWSSLAPNQMVSFTDAQGSGFVLKDGQSAVSSPRCMTKQDITDKYNVTITSDGSYAANQLVPKSAWVTAGLIFTVTAGSGSRFRGYTAGIFGSIAANPATVTFAGPGAIIKGVYTTDSSFYLEIFNGSNSTPPNGWSFLNVGDSGLQFNRANVRVAPYTLSNNGKWVYEFNYPVPFVGTNFFLAASTTQINIS